MPLTSDPIETGRPLFDNKGEPNEYPEAELGVQAYLSARAEGIPMVDLLERAVSLRAALREMNIYSSVEMGFITAVDTDGEEIWERYGDVTRLVESNADKKLRERLAGINSLIISALGHSAMQDRKDRLWVHKTTRYIVKNFKYEFMGPPNAPRRRRLSNKLKGQIAQQKQLRQVMGINIPNKITGIEQARW
jgi:hypothetical protein